MTINDKSRVVLVYGADQRLGHEVVSILQEQQQSVVPRATEFFDHDATLATRIHKDIRDKKPAVVINCLVDPDCGHEPDRPSLQYVATFLAMLQQCRLRGVRLIHCSSAQVYGQREVLHDRAAHREYDPAICCPTNRWSAVLQALEASLWQQTSLYNAAPMASTHPKFQAYVLRFGHLLHAPGIETRHASTFPTLPLDIAIHRMLSSSPPKIACPSPSALVSPITTEYAAECIADLCGENTGIPVGTYNIASRDRITLRQLFMYLATQTRSRSQLVVAADASAADISISGVECNRALDSSLWVSRHRRQSPNWVEAVDSLRQHTKRLAVI